MCHSPVFLELLVQDRQAELRRLAVEGRRREPAGESAGAVLTQSRGDGRHAMLEGLRRCLSFVRRYIASGIGRLRVPQTPQGRSEG